MNVMNYKDYSARIDPGVHAKAAMRAEAEGKSLNAWAQEALQRAITAP